MKITRNMALVTAMLAPMTTIGAEIQGAGFEISPRIVGGGNANTANWGFYTYLLTTRNNKRYACGASYLGDGYVLTAAHCVEGAAPSGMSVRVGATTRRGNDGQSAKVSQVYMHPNYSSRTLTNDVAVLKLDKSLPTATTVEIADGSLSQYVSIGDMLSVAGLGRTSEGGSSPSKLQEVDVPLVSDATCRAAGGSYNSVGEVAFCAGFPNGGKDSCQGDSGGPIVINRSGTITQLGIVSWGIGCAQAGKYGVYSDIAALRSWLDTVITSNPGGSYAVGYTKNQTLSSFKVGETKSHTFSIKNNGTQSFTLNNVRALASGVATSAVIGRDTCSKTTLTANQSCQVAVEFGATKAGLAKAQLSFSTDQGTSTYQANVSADATTAGGGGGNYDHVYPQNIGSYTFGTVVLAEDGNRYQCLGFPGGLWCSAGGAYAPGTGWAWNDAWSKL
ncbi:serine protease [Vibrio penaeicida]|uniref:trypsin-like serine protease n=1 Tax=Vibrio penaeicida TaxID=104609 RepID=UPI001F017A7C|nr:serine protease [Vibrio penaeicida]